MKAVIYCRVSSRKQVDQGHGLDGQESRCFAYAENNKMDVISVFKDEAISGGDDVRPSLYELIELVEQHDEKVFVIVDDINRLARDVVLHRGLKALIEKAGGELRSVNLHLDNSPEGQFVETIVAATGELEREQNKRRVLSRQKARLEAGYWTFYPPLGYRYEKDPVHGKLLVPYEPAATIIRQAYENFASGELETQADVKAFFETSGLKNSRGNKYEIRFEEVKRILTRQIYTGYIEYPKWQVKLRQGHHKPIVPFSVFKRVQEKINGKKKAYKSCNEEDFALRGLLLCSGCGEPLTASWSKGRNKKYAYYRCKNTHGCSVKSKSISRDQVENDFVEVLQDIHVKSEVLKLAQVISEKVFKNRSEDRGKQTKLLRKSLSDIEDRKSLVIDKIIKSTNGIVIQALENEVDKLEQEKIIVEQSINDSAKDNVNLSDLLSKVSDFLMSPASYWQEGNLKQKRLVQNLVFTDRVEYSKITKFGTANYSLPFKLLQLENGKKCEVVERGGFEPPSEKPTSSVLHA